MIIYPHFKTLIPTVIIVLSISNCAPIEEDSSYAGNLMAGQGFTGQEFAGQELAGGELAGYEPAGYEPAGGEPAGGELAGDDSRTSECSEQFLAVHDSSLTTCLNDLNTDNWCDLSDDIFYILKLSGVEDEFSCTDLDHDCSYHCDRWILPESFQDPDDRRASLNANVNRPVPENALPHQQLCIDEGFVENSNGSNGLYTCQNNLNTQEISFVKECENNGIIWVEPSTDMEGQFKVHLGWLSLEDPLSLAQPEVVINFEPDDAVCALNDDFSWGVLLVESNTHNIYEFNGDRFELINVNDELTSLTDQLSLSKLTVDESKLFSWSYSVSDPSTSASRVISVNRFFNSQLTYRDRPPQVISHKVRCLQCDNRGVKLRSAYLMEDSTVKLIDDDYDFEHELFNQLGPFGAIDSSDQLLALIPSGDQVTSLVFSLWSEAENLDAMTVDSSLLNFPLIFDATQWGFSQVELKTMSGMNALVKLTLELGPENNMEMDPTPANKSVWGVYNVLGNHLQLLNTVELENRLELDDSAEIQWADPLLHNQWISWHFTNAGIYSLITQQLSP